MNEEIMLFNHIKFGQLHMIDKNGEPWFIARDVCDGLSIDRTAIRRLDDDEKGLQNLHTPGGEQNLSIISFPGLLSLVLGCRKKEAHEYKRWVTHEVLPAIHKHGGYLTPEKIEEALLNPDTIIRLATDLKAERAKCQELEAKNEQMAPKALFADAVSASSTSILVGELAKLLRQNGIEIGQNRLFAWLRENGYLMKQGSSYNMPTQRAMEMELFTIKETTITHSDGHTTISKTPKVTGKGQQHFVNVFLTEKVA